MAGSTFSTVSLNNPLVTLLGFEAEIWQIAVVGVLLVALIAIIITAAIRSGKKRKVRIRKYIENEEKAILLRKQLREAEDEISRLNFDYAGKKSSVEAELKRINDDYRTRYGRADSEYYLISDRILKLNEKLRELSLKLKKKGIKTDEEVAVKAEFAKVEAEHSELSDKIVKLRGEKAARDDEQKDKVKTVESERAFLKEDYEAKLAEKTAAKKKIENDLEKLCSSQVKINVRDAEAILEEFRANDDAEKELLIKQAQEDVERAKNEYLEAKELRAQYERERADAVASAKEETKRKQTLEAARAETEAKVGYSSPDVTVTDEAETEKVNDALKAAEAAKLLEEYKNKSNDETAATETDEKAAEALENLETSMNEVDKKVSDEVVAEVEEEADAAKIHDETATTEEEENNQSTSETPDETSEEQSAKITEAAAEENVATEATPDENATNTATEAVTDNLADELVQTDDKPADNAETITDEEIPDGAEEPLDESNIEEFEEEIASIGIDNVETVLDDEISDTTDEIPADEENIEIAASAIEANDTSEIGAETAPENANETTLPSDTNYTSKDENATTEPEAETAATVAAAEEKPADKIVKMPKVIYNDGIPATPIHKKSKFAKPVTKLLVKKPAVKEEPAQEPAAKEETKKSAYLGKWKVEKTEDGKFFAKLRASNGGILLTTPVYSSEIGLKNGIASIKKCLAADNVTVNANKAGKFVFRITTPSGRTIVTSEQYGAKFQCEKALDSARRFAETAVITE